MFRNTIIYYYVCKTVHSMSYMCLLLLVWETWTLSALLDESFRCVVFNNFSYNSVVTKLCEWLAYYPLMPLNWSLLYPQVSVTIIEARQLAGPNINPCIEVRVGEKAKRTETQMSTNSPYYNQVCHRTVNKSSFRILIPWREARMKSATDGLFSS